MILAILVTVTVLSPSQSLERCCVFLHIWKCVVLFFNSTSHVWLVGWFTPFLPWDGDMAQTAIQVHAINLIELG